ncbi:MAG: ComF family protein [Lachnospiraceae bacterium]|nr:ComF family protein [Lachnospiraceae bacterium]
MDILKIFFPDRCPLCERVRPFSQTGFCPECILKLEKAKEFEKTNTDKKYYDGGISLYTYESINESLYRFKYMNRPEYAKNYAEKIDQELRDWLLSLNPDVLIPVPLHKKRLIKRGYNQARELALQISKKTGIPVNETCLKRVVNTAPLKLLNREERGINMKKAFIVVENVVNFRRAVIIDDIFTTGSTINAISKQLKALGVKEVYFLTLSRAGKQ